MLLIEADGKALLAEHGVPVPASVLVTDATIGILPGDGELPTDDHKHLLLETLAEKGLLQEVLTEGPTIQAIST